MYHVYVRDRKSFNGTYVNGVCIGDSKSLSRGYLLNDGDAIELRPHWKFVFNQVWAAPSKPLTALQLKECELFQDRYEVLPRTLGDGAEASAHLAIDAATKKQLVCKLINVGQNAHRNPKKALRSALQEADVLRQLHHPNILSYIDAICSPHSVYIFNELASGGDLFSFIRRHDTVTEFDSRIFLRQITRGLRFLHSKGITHRDLKPENILLANSPKIAYQRVLLSDFGACAIPKRSRMTSLVGTSTYQAPELCSKEKHTSAVDIWSLGIVTITLLTGESSVFNDVEELNQAALNTHIGNFLRERNAASFLAESFIIQCLQISPPDRLTPSEAQHHDWLCTPAKHVEFFEELDRRMLESWSVHNELLPMPMELPDVTQPTQSQSQVIPATPSQLSQVTSESQSSARQASLERRSKRIKLLQHRNIQVPDHLHLPLNSLDKHLKQPPSQDYREKVLQQLQDSQTKFLA